jgi:hypothetical protein
MSWSPLESFCFGKTLTPPVKWSGAERGRRGRRERPACEGGPYRFKELVEPLPRGMYFAR